MYYRTKTYLAGDWDGDKDLIQQIMEWNNRDYYSLTFSDAHRLTQARDTSLNCSIKKSLSERLNASKSFVLVVGEHTASVTKGSCQYCQFYRAYSQLCTRKMNVDTRSYIEYECEKARSDYDNGRMRIIVVYNYQRIHRDRCPEILKDIGLHIPGKTLDENGYLRWNYQEIKNAIKQ